MMVRRYLILEQPAWQGKHGLIRIQVHVDDRAAIGPWVTTLAARLGYPLVDPFGSPLPYRLRSVSGEQVLPTSGRFADVRFSSGSSFVLEAERQNTLLIREDDDEERRAHQTSMTAQPFSRRSLISMLTTLSFLGFASGVTTDFAQRLLPLSKRAPVPITVQTLFAQHQQPVRTLTWSPDGQVLASGGTDGMAFVWTVDGTVLSRLPFPTPVHALSWSPDGRHLLAATATTVSFFDAHTGRLLAENTTQHTASITALGWTQEAVPCAISAGRDKTAVVWSAQSYQPLVVFRGHTSAIEALAVVATTVVTVSEGGLARTWSALSGQEIHGYYSQSPHPLRTAAISSRGSLAIGGDDGIIALWRDGRTCQRQTQGAFGVQCLDSAIHLQRQRQPVRALAFSADGSLLATSGDDKTLIIWSMQTMKPLLIQRQQEVPVALSWSPTGSLLAGTLGQRVALWSIQL